MANAVYSEWSIHWILVDCWEILYISSMTECSKVATVCSLSLIIAKVRIPTGTCGKVASDLGCSEVRRVLRFRPPLTTGSSGIRIDKAEQVTILVVEIPIVL